MYIFMYIPTYTCIMRRQHENQPFVCGDVGQLRLFRQGDHAMRLRPDIYNMHRLLLVENIYTRVRNYV